MKKSYIIILLTIISLQVFSQVRQVPSNRFEAAEKSEFSYRTLVDFAYQNDFQDSTSLYNMNIDNLDSLADNSEVSTLTGLNFLSSTWILLHYVDDSNVWAASNSYFETPGQADRWLITPEITVLEGYKLSWRSKSVRYYDTSSTNESYEIYISTTLGNSYDDFILAPVITVIDEDTSWTDHELDLAAFNGDSIYIAFRHISDNQGILALDDIEVGSGPSPPSGIFGDFEDFDDFTFDLNPWLNLDLDSSITYTIQGISFPHSGEAMPFIVFNPYSTSPLLADADPHGGERYGACFASVPVSQGGNGPNNDWLISPEIVIAPNGWLKFWARSFTSVYGLERFKVGVSTTDNNPASFTVISDGDYIEADTAWTEYSYDLSSYSGQEVYVAINCVSDNSFVFFIDDVSIDTVLVQDVNELNVKNISLYPNPSTGIVNVRNSGDLDISVFNSLGLELINVKIYSDIEKSIDLSQYPNGVYYIRLYNNKEVFTLPFQLIK